MSELLLRLDDPRQSYHPGDTLSGELLLALTQETQCKAFRVELRWHTHGRGDIERDPRPQVITFPHQEVMPAGRSHHPFSFTLPAGPYSYQGHYITLEWELHALFDIPWDLGDLKASHPVTLLPPHRPTPSAMPIPAPPNPLAKKPDLSPLFLVGGAGGLAAAVVIVVLALASPEVFGMFLCCTPVLGMLALAMLVFGARLFLGRQLVRDPRVTLTPCPQPAGGSVDYGFTFTPGKSLTIKGIYVTLTCEEITFHGHGTARSRHTWILHKQDIPLSGPLAVRSGTPVHHTATIALPEQAPFSMDLGTNQIQWHLTTHVDLEGVASWSDTTPLHVVPRHHLPPRTRADSQLTL